MKKVMLLIAIIIVIFVVYNKIYINRYYFKLKGSDTIYLNIGDTWEDPLYEVSNIEVKKTDNINYNKEGEYEVNYTIQIGIFKRTLSRKIIIYSENRNTNFILNIEGDNPYYLMINHDYQELGASAYDQFDGSLTDKIIITNNIDNNTPGTYEVKYQVKNTNGIIKNKTRKVIVYSLNFNANLKTQEYTQSNEIILNINDNNYNYTILPDGSKTENKIINYPVFENKKYLFNLYDIHNDVLNYEVNVTNIDNEKPTGNCILSLKDIGGEINVTAKDNNQIKGYEYQYGNTKTKILKDSKYYFNTMDEKVSVTIYDVAENSNTITCSTVDNSTITPRSYTIKTYNYNGTNNKYWFYEPKISKRTKVPLLIYFHGAGGSASLNAINNIAIPKNIKDGNDFPYYVIAPYNAHNTSSENYVLELIDYISRNYQIDTKRIVLTGGSMGSQAPLRIASNYPNKFSCIAIIAAYNITSIEATEVTNIPIWIFQGSLDNYATMENYVNQINKAGGNAKITSYKGGHDAPVNAFLRTDLTQWILTNYAK